MTTRNPLTLLIVEDDPSIRMGLEEVLRNEGFTVVSCDRGDAVVERTIAECRPDLLVLDVMLPGRSGLDVCRDLRAAGVSVPVLMLTAKGQEADKVNGLECGADDYVTKPFGIRELVARIHALLRRAGSSNTSASRFHPRFLVGDAEVTPKTFEITRAGNTEALTPKELQLLLFFHLRRGEALSREELLRKIWAVHSYNTTRTLDQTVAQLRKKIGDSGTAPRIILTVHGIGYRMVEP